MNILLFIFSFELFINSHCSSLYDLEVNSLKTIFFCRVFDVILISGCDSSNLFFLRKLINDFLSFRGLSLQKDFFYIKSIYEGFDFLGWYFLKKFQTNLLTLSHSESVKKYKSKLKLIVKNNIAQSSIDLVLCLNQEISDWLFNFGFLVYFDNTCLGIDFYLYKLLWKWAKRRHSRRPNTWIYSKYWKFINGRWNFFVFDSKNGRCIFLKSHLSSTLKFYHLPLSLNSFDILNENKLQNVLFKKFLNKFDGIYYVLWKKQYGLCVCCRKFLFLYPSSNLKICRVSSDKELVGINSFSKFVLLHKFCYYKF